MKSLLHLFWLDMPNLPTEILQFMLSINETFYKFLGEWTSNNAIAKVTQTFETRRTRKIHVF